MRKFLAAVFTSLALVLTGVISAPIASAAPSIETAVSAKGSFGTIPTSGVAIAPPNVIGGGVNKPMWRYVSCYLAMDGYTYCWRYSCTSMEYWFYGCRDGWYRLPKTWYA